MFEEMGIEKTLKDFGNSRSQSNMILALQIELGMTDSKLIKKVPQAQV